MTTAFKTPKNDLITTLGGNYTAGSGDLTVATGTGSLFGTVSTSHPVRFTVITAATYQTLSEVLTIFQATGITGDILTGVSAIEGTTDQNFSTGDKLEERTTAGMFTDIYTAINTLETNAVPSGPGGAIQFDASGLFDGDAALTWNNTSKNLFINGRIGVGTDTPDTAYHQVGGGIRLEPVPRPTPSMTNVGTAGGTTVYYWIIVEDLGGNYSSLGGDGVTTTSNATLNGTNYNQITFGGVEGAKRYLVVKASSDTLDADWYIGQNVLVATVDDTGSGSYTVNDQSNTGSLVTGPTTPNDQTADAFIGGSFRLGSGSTTVGNYSQFIQTAGPDSNSGMDIVIWRDNSNTTLSGVDGIGCLHTLITSGAPGPDGLAGGSMQYDSDTAILYIWGSPGWTEYYPFNPTNTIAYTGQQYFEQQTLTDGSTINWNLLTQQAAVVTLGGNRTLANPTNMAAGLTATLIVIQDGTGSRVLTFGTAYKWAGGTAPTLSTAAGSVDIITFLSDGTNMYGTCQKAFA